MTDALYKIVAFAVTLGVLVVFHELGHYVVARLAGVKVVRAVSVATAPNGRCRRSRSAAT